MTEVPSDELVPSNRVVLFGAEQVAEVQKIEKEDEALRASYQETILAARRLSYGMREEEDMDSESKDQFVKFQDEGAKIQARLEEL